MEVQQPGEIIALARARRSLELGRLPGWGAALTPQAWQRLRGCEADVSSGTLVVILRAARQQGQIAVTKDIFTRAAAAYRGGERVLGKTGGRASR